MKGADSSFAKRYIPIYCLLDIFPYLYILRIIQRPQQRSSQKDRQQVAILCDNRVCYFSMSGEPLYGCTSDT